MAAHAALIVKKIGLLAIPVAIALGSCAVVPVGQPVYEPPAYVEEPPASVWVWAPWPHYEVDHHYVIQNDRVVIHDQHYTPFHRETRRYIQNRDGKHPGWYRHDR